MSDVISPLESIDDFLAQHVEGFYFGFQTAIAASEAVRSVVVEESYDGGY